MPLSNPGSPRFTLNSTDLASITRGALLAAAGGIVAYLSTQVLPHLDQSTMLGATIAGLGSIAVNAFRKYVADNQ
ncbi:MAG: hypothetical protein O2955_04730 [Planctomycetota bacterium]|nr:hypothetical protein [Planctomycetota bacterium]MDA1211796.1 hypothetical protein [Planctomycetota bacterium]